MERMKLDVIQTSMNFLSETCNNHTYIKDGVECFKVVKMMDIDGQAVCPLCESEKRKMELENEMNEFHKDRLKYPNKLIFRRDSLVSDETILKARFGNFEADGKEEAHNLELVKSSVLDFTKGKSFTLWLQGKPGTGKSHLSYAFAHEVNKIGKYKVLFIDMSELVKEIRSTFNNQSTETEQSIIKKLTSTDLLILDDIGSEVGNIDTNNTASDFISRVVFAIFNGRQGKTTICTTNLSGSQLKRIYDAKTFSRMFRDYRFIKFENSKDRRFIELPF